MNGFIRGLKLAASGHPSLHLLTLSPAHVLFLSLCCSDDEGEEARPLTREELKSKTLNRLNRRAGKDAARAKAKKNAQR